MLEMSKVLDENSVDSIVCDPPYELGFMGKEWDKTGIAFQKETWQECLKVLKDGGYMLVFGGSRTYHRIAVAIEDAGFEIRDTIMWLYGSGFPKSHNISIALDKHLGEEREVIGKAMGSWSVGKNDRGNQVFVAKNENEDGTINITAPSSDLAKQWNGWGTALKPAFEPIIVVRKPMKTTVAENVIKYGVGGINIDECRVPFGKETDNRVGTTIKRGDSKKYKYNELDKETFEAFENDEDLVWSEATSDFENIDEFYEFLEDYHFYKPKERLKLGFDIFDYERVIIDNTDRKNVIPLLDTFLLNSDSMFGQSKKGVQMYESEGRFPANLIHDGSDEVVSLFPETSPSSSGGISSGRNFGQDYNNESVKQLKRTGHDDNGGSAARYFYTAKTSKKDRDEGLEHFKNKAITNKKGNGLNRVCNICGTPQLTPCDCENNSWVLPENRKNIHPTVKPTDLMQYLVRLVSPKGATILDCFMGSGSTGKAVMFENRERDANYKFIGFDLEKEYCEIAHARIDYALNKYEYDIEKEIQEAEEKGQLSLF